MDITVKILPLSLYGIIFTVVFILYRDDWKSVILFESVYCL